MWLSLSVKRALLLCVLGVASIELWRAVASIPMLAVGIPLLPLDNRFWIAIALGFLPVSVLRGGDLYKYLLAALFIGCSLGCLLVLANVARCWMADSRCVNGITLSTVELLIAIYVVCMAAAGYGIFRATRRYGRLLR